MHWTKADIERVKKEKGLKVDDTLGESVKPKKPTKKIVKISVEKKTIELWLNQFKDNGVIDDFVSEYKFIDDRRFRFDWAIPSLLIGIEYEGLMSKKSRHTTKTGYSTDCEKYNLASINGWTVLRYTALNYKNFEDNLSQLIDMINNNTSELP